MKFLKSFITVFSCIALCSCASYRPILDQNQKYTQVGKQQADSDVDACIKQADEYLKDSKANRLKKEAGRKAIIGAVAGAAAGVIFGHNLKSTMISTAIGTGAGALYGAGSVAAEDRVKPDVIKQRYLTNCLGREGYSIIGWE